MTGIKSVLRHRLGILVCILALTWLTGGCSSSSTIGVTGAFIDLSGSYRSSSAAGSLGVLELELAWIENTTWFNALAGSDLSSELVPSEGICTTGDLHLVINFDRGLLSDYYFEGTVVLDGATVEAINGRFVFPDMAETLAVTFLPD